MSLLDLLHDSVGGASIAFGSEDHQGEWVADGVPETSWPEVSDGLSFFFVFNSIDRIELN